MRQLIIDTATEALSVALFVDGACIAFHHEIAGRGHAEKLMPIIAALPDGGRADEIIVDTGPGSFTGVRVGLAAARALGYAWGAQIKGYASLSLIAAIAHQKRDSNVSIISIAITGGHGELFWQNFDENLRPQAPIASTPIMELAKVIDKPVIYGTGAQSLVDAREFGEAILLHPDARSFTLLLPEMIQEEASALYGRGADAVPLAQRRPKA